MTWLDQYQQIPTYAHGPRKGVVIDTVVWHWTGGWREAESVAKIDYQRKKNRVSAHFTIGRDGTVIQSVPMDRAAWHAGGSKFVKVPHPKSLNGRRLYMPPTNARSVGVEICNRGFLRGDDRERLEDGSLGRSRVYEGRHRNPASRKDGWERYTQAQHDAISELAQALEAAIPTLRYHTGHEDVFNRQHTKGAKLDPGPAFPWDLLQESEQTMVVRWAYTDRDWEYWSAEA